MTTAVDVCDVAQSYGAVRAVDGVSFRVDVGECFGLLGPNGAGKSTLIRMLSTLERPSAGRMVRQPNLVYGRDDSTIRQTIGVALQETGVDPLMTGFEILMLAGRLSGFATHQAADRAAQLLDRFQLREVGRRPVRTYSGGMRRRLDLASALVHDPSLIILDEPTTGLDPVSRELLWNSLRDLVRVDHKTVLLTTQYLDEADALCDRLLFINHGRTIAQGSPADLKRAMGYSTIRFQVDGVGPSLAPASIGEAGLQGSLNGEILEVVSAHPEADILRIAAALSEVRMSQLEIQPPSLDDVFRYLTVHEEGEADAVHA